MHGVWCPLPTDTYQVVKPIGFSDSFGHFEKDLLFDQLKIFLKTNEILPKAWKTDQEKVVIFLLFLYLTINQLVEPAGSTMLTVKTCLYGRQFLI